MSCGIANTYEGSGLFRIDVKNSTAGKGVKLSTSRPTPPKLPFLVVPVPVPLAVKP